MITPEEPNPLPHQHILLAMKTAILTCCLVVCMTAEVVSQSMSEARADQIRTEIETVHGNEQEAFVSGDCAAMASFYAEDVTFYANGRVVPSPAAISSLCRRIPRPFEQSGTRRDSIHLLSETAAYLVRVIDFPPQDEETGRHGREVVTKVWSKGPEGWKIVHFHSSTSVVTEE